MIGMNLMILSSVYTFTKASDIYFRLHSNFSRDSLNPFTLQFAKYDSRSFMNDANRTVVIFLLDVHYFTKKNKFWLAFIIRNVVPLSILTIILYMLRFMLSCEFLDFKNLIPFIMFLRSIWFLNSEHFLLISVINFFRNVCEDGFQKHYQKLSVTLISQVHNGRLNKNN